MDYLLPSCRAFTSAAFTIQLPLSGDLEDGYGVHFESSPTGNPEADNAALRYVVSPGYFETMAIPLRRGRLLNEHDVADSPLVVLISESLAKSKFTCQDPIGQRLRIGPSDGPWYTVVGVVGNVKQTSLVFRQGMTLTILGVVIGLSGAVAATQAIVTLLFGVSRLDPITCLGVITLLVGVSVIACWVPAWRAARVDPSITLRAE